MKNDEPTRAAAAGFAVVESRALWLLLAVGALLMLAAAASGEERGESATRTERIHATPAPGRTVRVQNVNGDVVASGGASFSAAVTITASAATRARAEELLEKTRVVQSEEGNELRIETVWPREFFGGGRDRSRGHVACRDCRVTARYELTLPPGTPARLETVNGEVRVHDVDGALNLHTVNGNVLVVGARRALRAQTVNGRLDAAAAALPADAAWDLQTVNGAVLATLPKDARFVWTASTMSGGIASTFALPVRGAEAAAAPVAAPAPPAPPAPGTPAPPRRHAIVVENGDDEDVVDVAELSREIEESLREVQDAARERVQTMREIRVALPQRSYTGTIGGGGATLRTNTLNGNITLLAAGTREAEAKALVSGSRSIVVTVPRVEVRVPRVQVRVPRVHVHPAPHVDVGTPEPDEEESDEVVRGDIAGDFLSTSNGSYRLGHVAGRVKVLTRSGEIHLASAGKGAELKTFGGDIRLGPIRGDLKAQTLAGDIRATEVTGAAVVETSGGDIRIERVGGSVNARTDGGDVVLPLVEGAAAVAVETGGGEVRLGLLSRSVKGGVTVENAGGDVLLTLPSDFQADVELRVEGPADPEDVLIRSEFPGIAVTRGAESQRGTGALNGGGPRLTVKTASGSIRIRRGPAARS
jgi:DUF4097 and DUF4098 domain-containing protein YvlB